MKAIALALLASLSLAGCTDIFDFSGSPDTCDETYAEMGFDGETWPDLSGCPPVRILSHSSFAAFEDARSVFQNLTGGDAVLVAKGDTGTALNVAIQEKDDPRQHLVYGLDNAYLAIALDEGVVEPYTPLLHDRVQDRAVFFDGAGPWPATPADQGFVGINWDPDGPGMDNVSIEDLFDVRGHADKFVTQDPHTSSPGLGFMLITIGHFGEGGPYDWLDYWHDLFDAGVLITAGWTEAYENHFSGGYGRFIEGAALDKPIVNSYSESPAVEHYFGTPENDIPRALVAPHTTWHQVQTTAKLAGGENDAVAEAWIEFTLTDDFQELAFANGVYPVVDGIPDAYGDIDPEPGTFEPVDLDFEDVGADLTRWLDAWNDVCEANDACT